MRETSQVLALAFGGTARANSDRPTSSVALHLETGANAHLDRLPGGV